MDKNRTDEPSLSYTGVEESTPPEPEVYDRKVMKFLRSRYFLFAQVVVVSMILLAAIVLMLITLGVQYLRLVI